MFALAACQAAAPPTGDDDGADAGSSAEPTIEERLQRSLDDACEADKALGCGAAITIPNKGVWIGVTGLAKPGGAPLVITDRYPVGSITKVFTAVVILQLVEEGAMSLDDPLSKWYSTFPRATEIKVKQLLDHTSGIVDYLEDTAADTTKPTTHENMIEYPKSKGLKFDPGSQWDYSNTNYIFLGLIAEKVSGKTYAQLVRTRVIDKLALADTFLDGDELIPGGFVMGYSFENNTYKEYPREHPSWAWAAGAIVASLPDQIKFFDRLINSTDLLEAETLAKMKAGVQIPMAPAGVVYGLGLESGPTDWGPFHTHGGLIHDVKSASGAFPDAGLVGAAYANTYQSDGYNVLFPIVETVTAP